MTTTSGQLWRRAALAGAAAALAGRLWFTDRAPYPYAQRWLLDLPLPGLGNTRLDRILQPRPGERILEVGPGTGLQALHVAARLGPTGRLDIVDVQQQMLDHVARRVACAGGRPDNIVATRADAQQLPFPDGSFDAAYLVTALGEIPRPGLALRELHRVLKPPGRLVVGEFFDRHRIPLATLRAAADACGFTTADVLGWGPVSYLARFHVGPGTASPSGVEPLAPGAPQ